MSVVLNPTCRDLASVGNGVYIGNAKACDVRWHDFAVIVHIWKEQDGDGRCRQCRGLDPPFGLCVHWVEDLLPDRLSIPLADLIAYLRRPGDALVHCHGGVCRSPFMALAAKVARGCDPWQAIADIYQGQFRDRGLPIEWNPKAVLAFLRTLPL